MSMSTTTEQKITVEEVERITKENVERGIALLNDHLGPDWPNLIDQETFDIASPSSCVLGQLYADKEPTEEQFAVAERISRETAAVARDDSDGYCKGLVILDGDVLRHPGQFGFSTLEGLSERWYQEHGYDEEDGAPHLWSLLQDEWDRRFEELKTKIGA
jgi:hypothetical protein